MLSGQRCHNLTFSILLVFKIWLPFSLKWPQIKEWRSHPVPLEPNHSCQNSIADIRQGEEQARRNTDEVKKKRRKKLRGIGGGGIQWCWHGREPRHFNALVGANSFQWEFGLAFNSVCSKAQFAKWFVERKQKRSTLCLWTFFSGFRLCPLASFPAFFWQWGARAYLPFLRSAQRKWFIFYLNTSKISTLCNCCRKFVWHFFKDLNRPQLDLCFAISDLVQLGSELILTMLAVSSVSASA